jgi:hypothetical protein
MAANTEGVSAWRPDSGTTVGLHEPPLVLRDCVNMYKGLSNVAGFLVDLHILHSFNTVYFAIIEPIFYTTALCRSRSARGPPPRHLVIEI